MQINLFGKCFAIAKALPLKPILAMKLTALMLLMCLHVSAKSYSQKIAVSTKNLPLAKVFSLIEQQTGYTFFYDNKLVKNAGSVTIDVKNASVEQVLNMALKGRGLTYTIVDKTIVIKSKPPEAVEIKAIQDVKGKVTDAKGEGLPGVTIKVKGTPRGTATDVNGNFSINIEPQTILVFSYLGFITKEVTYTGQELLSVVMEQDVAGLQEVVVVGYSSKTRDELASAVTVVSEEELKDVTTNNLGAMLQGKVAGLQVVNSTGVPGAASEIRLRGISSINASQSPLVVVDGIIGGNFDPNDVENVTVLKDAGATAIYGSQANAGVLIVTTKKAKAGKTQFEAKATTGFRSADRGEMVIMNGAELYNYQKEFYRDYIPGAADNSYKVDLLKFYNERPRTLPNQNNDWFETLLDKALVQNYYFSASGSSEKNDYYAGVTYYDEKGTLANSSFQRINIRANSTYRFNKNISVTNNINLSGTNGKSYDFSDIYYAYLNLPWDNPYDENGALQYVDGNTTFKWWSRDKQNPLHTVQNSNHPYKGGDINYDLALNVNINKWLTFNSANRLAGGYNKAGNFFSPLVAGQYNTTGYIDAANVLTYGGISTNLLKFNFTTGDHNISGLGGVAFEGSQTEINGASGKGLPIGLNVLNVVSSNQTVNGLNNRSAIQSLISQANYSYKNKYFITGSYRVDGSSAFPEGNQYASFPSVSAAWLVSKEAFLESNKAVDQLKLRLSYGVTGTQDIGPSRYLGLYSLTSQYNSQIGATPLQLASPNLTWESKYQLNAGIDLGLFKRLSLTVDAYRNITKDLLLQVSQPLSVGFETRWDNVGEIENKGIEIGLSSTNIKSTNFQWHSDFNINFNSNTLRGLPSPIVKTGAWSISQIYRNGGKLYEFYMPKWLGVDVQTGAPIWEKTTTDADGNITGREPTSTYSEATQQEVGSALPKFQGGFNNEFTYKNLSLRVNAYFVSGNKVFSNTLRFLRNDGNEPYYNQANLPEGSSIWTKPGDIATEPSPQNAAGSTETSSRYLKDGSFISIRNVSLSYKLSDAVARRLKAGSIVLSLSADNVYTFTDFLGQDPQTTITPGAFVTPGVSDFKYPNNRQYLFNVNVRF